MEEHEGGGVAEGRIARCDSGVRNGGVSSSDVTPTRAVGVQWAVGGHFLAETDSS